MSLDNAAELVGQRRLNGIDQVITVLDALHADAISGRDPLGPIEGHFVHHEVNRHGLHPLGSEPHIEDELGSTPVRVLRLNWVRCAENESHMVPEVNRSQPLQLFYRVAEVVASGKQVDIPGRSRVDRACQNRLPAF